jgi:hypothetical protein
MSSLSMPALPRLPSWSWRTTGEPYFVGAICIGLTKFPRGPRGLPLAIIYLLVIVG